MPLLPGRHLNVSQPVVRWLKTPKDIAVGLDRKNNKPEEDPVSLEAALLIKLD